MSATQFQALIRQLLSIGGGYLVGGGYLDGAQAETLIGAIAALAGLSWSIYASRKVGVLNAAAKIDAVEGIMVSPSSHLSDKVASDKVVSSI